MTELVQVVTTCPDRESAGRLAQALVEQRLAACVQVEGPIQSTYWWQGRIESAEEWRLAAKTLRILFPDVEAAIRRLHSYQEPEILALPVAEAAEGYRQWLLRELEQPPQTRE